MGFLGVYKALYDYAPQSEGELAISEGNLLYVLGKDGDDGWWKAKKKASGDDEEEPEGLIPNNYVIEVRVEHVESLWFGVTRGPSALVLARILTQTFPFAGGTCHPKAGTVRVHTTN